MAEFRQKLRGTTAQLDTLNGAQGLLAVDLTRLELRLYDGNSAAGSRIPNLNTITANFLSLSTGGTVTGRLASTTSVAAYTAAGGPALDTSPLTNQGRLSFNHENGVPVVDRNSGAIAFNMDDDANPLFEFSLVAANRVASPVPLDRALTLNRTNLTLNPDGGAGAPTLHIKAAAGNTNSYLLMGDSGAINDDFVLRHFTSSSDSQEVLFSVRNVVLFSMANGTSSQFVRTRVPAQFDSTVTVTGGAVLQDNLTVLGTTRLNDDLTMAPGLDRLIGFADGGGNLFHGLRSLSESINLESQGSININADTDDSGSAAINFRIGPVTVGAFTTAGNFAVTGELLVTGGVSAQDSSLPDGKRLVNREAGDGRYVKRDGSNTMTGDLTITGNGPDTNAISLGIDTRLTWSNDHVMWRTGLGFYGYENGSEVFRIEAAGSGLPQPTSVVTRARGDGRYLQKTDTTIPNPVMEAIKDELIDFFVPVGTVLGTTNNVNPGTRFAGTTWVAHAAGRAVVGVGSNGESTWAAGELRGAETHIITPAQMPSHLHSGTTGTESQGHLHGFNALTTPAGGHNHQRNGGGGFYGVSGGEIGTGNRTGGTGINFTESFNTTSVGDHQHGVSGTTDTVDRPHTHSFNTSVAGSDQAHNNIQPSEATYLWERVA